MYEKADLEFVNLFLFYLKPWVFIANKYDQILLKKSGIIGKQKIKMSCTKDILKHN